jgi:hypothetical protein
MQQSLQQKTSAQLEAIQSPTRIAKHRLPARPDALWSNRPRPPTSRHPLQGKRPRRVHRVMPVPSSRYSQLSRASSIQISCPCQMPRRRIRRPLVSERSLQTVRRERGIDLLPPLDEVRVVRQRSTSALLPRTAARERSANRLWRCNPSLASMLSAGVSSTPPSSANLTSTIL